MLLRWLISAASLTTSLANLHPESPDKVLFELVIHQDFHSGTCTFTSLRKTTQIHKDLSQDGLLNEHAKFTSRGERTNDIREAGAWERLRYFACSLDRLWNKAQEICGPSGMWDHQTLLDVGEQDTPNSWWTKQARLNFNSLSLFRSYLDDVPPLEVIPLVQSGPSSNRVDFTFFSDGYTIHERSKFVEDARRLAMDISSNHTFNTVRPMINMWAAFTPSKESGVGVGGKPKDTVFGLYRDGTELRGVYYSKPEKARAACFSLGDKCNYPILVGNDNLYGGLGGEFTVITPSILNGPLVLRHELGHSVIDVGEEYDGGFAYFGVNAFHEHSLPSWTHWLTPLTEALVDNSSPRVERSIMPLQDYAWKMLNTSAPWRTSFTSSGTYSRHLVRFSLSGLPKATDLLVELDGHNLGWEPAPGIGEDRWHYDIHVRKPLNGGKHEISFSLLNGGLKAAQLCSVEILEYGTDDEFNALPGVYSLFPTYSIENVTSYRPTNEDCLMRLVTSPDFCSVCLEGLWLALARRVSLIDTLEVGSCPVKGGGRPLKLDLVPFAPLSEEEKVEGKGYTIRWYKDGLSVPKWDDKVSVVTSRDEVGRFSAHVAFSTKEVRQDSKGYLQAQGEITISKPCM